MNKVIIVGGDHHNGLNLARIFGINDIFVISIVISDSKYSWISKSKYIKESFSFKTTKYAFDFILENYNNLEEKPFIIPYSDGAAMELDSRLNEFCNWAIVPSINGEQGKIVSLMHKKSQYDFSVNNNIKIAGSFILDLHNVDNIKNINYPLILKPNISAVGDKKDIRICTNEGEFNKSVKEFQDKGYESVLVQDYLKIDNELVLVGAISRDDLFFVANKVIRQWPVKTGSNSYSMIENNPKILQLCKNLFIKIKELGYTGLIDIEVFVVNGEIYLNEINWRNSGGDFRALSNGFYYAYWWYCDKLGIECNKNWDAEEVTYSMVEYADWKNIFKKKVSIFEWIKQYKNTANYSIKFKRDNKPGVYKVIYFLLRKIGF